jgi:hypothetical protein
MIPNPQECYQVIYSPKDWTRVQSILDGVNPAFGEVAAQLGWFLMDPYTRGVPSRGIARSDWFRESTVSLTHMAQLTPEVASDEIGFSAQDRQAPSRWTRSPFPLSRALGLGEPDTFLLWATVGFRFGWIRYLGLKDRILLSRNCGPYSTEQLKDHAVLRSAVMSGADAICAR